MTTETRKNEAGISAPQPVRRVGSLTLGCSLMAAGAFFLLYSYLPGFSWQTALRLAPPAALILLGGEVLYAAARPGRRKYDFWAVFSCLVLMGCAFGLSLLPVLWKEYGPERNEREWLLESRYTQQLCDSLSGQVPLEDLESYVRLLRWEDVPLDQQELTGENAWLSVDVKLYGPYEEPADFAADCRTLLGEICAQQVKPDQVFFCYDEETDGTAEGGRLELRLSGPVQLDWTGEQMAQQVETLGRFERTEPAV